MLDDSASMRRTAGETGGEQLFERARAQARSLIEHLSPESDAALVLASEGTPTPIAEPSSDRGAPAGGGRRGVVLGAARRSVVGDAQGGADPDHVGARRADHLFITDLQAAGWEDGHRPARDQLGPAAVRGGDPGREPRRAWNNRAVVDLGAEPAPEAGPLGVAVVAEIANFSDQPAAHVGVTLKIDGAQVARGFVDMPAHGRARKRFLHTLAGGGTAHEAEVEIDHDRFALDDRRLARVEVSRGLRVLVVNGDPRTVRTEDETFFLEAALHAGGSSFVVDDRAAGRAAGAQPVGLRAIFLANVARPAPRRPRR